MMDECLKDNAGVLCLLLNYKHPYLAEFKEFNHMRQVAIVHGFINAVLREIS